ncbi:MAG: DegQ family serine endoprotease [Gammaproteobacteria bacterium]
MKNRNIFAGLLISISILISVASFEVAARYNLPDFTELVEEHADAVVNISTSKQTEVKRGLPPGMDLPEMPEGSPFGEFFEKFFGEHGGNGGEEFFNSRSLGSGFIISKDGYVITNHHVVKGADEIIVKLSDRRQLVAEMVGSDPRSDIALLKLEGDDFPSVKLGDSDAVKVGQWVLAIGSPFGFDASVTAGIVSAKGRSLPSENYVPFIQTDVAINPGNSGGPLFDLDGKVVGINSQIYTRSGGFMGLSFAIPIEDAMDVVDQLKTSGYVSRGWLGVYIQEVTRELAESFGMEKPTGALVAKILPESPAQDTDLQIGDIILSYNNEEVKNSASLPPLVGRTRVGDTVKLKIMRNGKTKTVKLEIGQLPDKDQSLVNKVTPEEEVEDSVFGLVLRPLTDEEMNSLELENSGLLVLDAQNGVAKSAGIRKGDVIQMINGEPVETVKAFTALMESLPEGKFISILVQRSHGPEFLAMRIPEKE